MKRLAKRSQSKEYLLGVKLSQENLNLSKREAESCLKIYFKVEYMSCLNNICLFKIKGDLANLNRCLDRLAFSKEGYLFSKSNSFDNSLKDLLVDLNLPHGEASSFKILPILYKESEKANIISSFASKVLEKSISGKISLSNPDFVVCASTTPNLLGVLVWTNKDASRHRRMHLKPAPHPSGIDPRLARAMINLASAKFEVFDPFCGAGGILEEVKLLSLKYIGTDISWKMINLARANLKSKDGLFCKDALLWDRQVECVVTDLPYGKNSKLVGSLNVLINNFFEKYITVTSKIVVCAPNSYDLEFYAKNHGWTLYDFFEVYVHGSLTRKIHVFENTTLINSNKRDIN
ncbi:MAG: TRM11 family SAM-dependent methyltransferase [Candidatus Woesearchaeota archaeon]